LSLDAGLSPQPVGLKAAEKPKPENVKPAQAPSSPILKKGTAQKMEKVQNSIEKKPKRAEAIANNQKP